MQCCEKFHVVCLGRDSEGRILRRIVNRCVSKCCAEAKVVILRVEQPLEVFEVVPVVCGSYAV